MFLDEAQWKSRLETNINMLRAALLGILGTKVYSYLENVDPARLDSALEGMPYKNDSLEKAIKLQKIVNERKSGLGATSSAGHSFAAALADFMMSQGAEYLTVNNPENNRTFSIENIVKELTDSEKNEFFDAIVANEKSTFDIMCNYVYSDIKTAAVNEILRAIDDGNYNTVTLEKRVEHLKKLTMMKPYMRIEPHLQFGVPINEQHVEWATTNYLLKNIDDILKQSNVAKTFDDNKLQNTLELCRILKGQNHSNAKDFEIALTPVVTYLKDCPDYIDFKTADVNAHVPIKTLMDNLKAHPERLFTVTYNFLGTVGYMNSVTNSQKSIRSLFVYKLLVPLFAWLPTHNFAHLTKVSDGKILQYDFLASDLRNYRSDKAFKVEYLNALIKLADQNSRKNVLFLWGTLESTASFDDMRARLDAIRSASATDVPKEVIIDARARLLENQNEDDPALKALYKSYYEAVKTMYVPKNGEVLDQLFPNEWHTA